MGSSSSNKSLAKRVDSYIEENDVMIFSKTYCPYCTMAKQVFSDLNVDFKVLELDNIEDGSEIQKILSKKTGASSVPRVFVRGKCIGGGTETKQLHSQGKLKDMVKGTE